MHSSAKDVDSYLLSLPPDRRSALQAVRQVILDNLPAGYEEAMKWGMICYQVPLSTFPVTYNGQPLALAGLASQKNHMSVYLMGIYSSETSRQSFETAYRATGKRFDVGKSCVRFRKLEDLPLDLIAQVIASLSVDDFLSRVKNAQSQRKARPAGDSSTK